MQLKPTEPRINPSDETMLIFRLAICLVFFTKSTQNVNIQEYRTLQTQSWDIDNQQFAESFVNPNLKGIPRETAEKYNELVKLVMGALQPSETKNAVLLQIKQAKDAHIAQWFSEQPKPEPKKD